MIAALTPFLIALGPVALLLMMGVLFAETGLLIGFFLPGDSLLFTAGILTATGVVHVPFWVMAVGEGAQGEPSAEPSPHDARRPRAGRSPAPGFAPV